MELKIQIYILCRDRPEFAMHAIGSVVNSANENTEVIISDNSVTNSVKEMCRKHFSAIKYIKRNPPLASAEHFKVILDEASEDFLALFHDDDIMLPNYVAKMMSIIEGNPSAVAVGCNSLFFYDGEKYPFTLAHRFKFQISFKDEVSFFIQNLCDPRGIAPFPSYIYRTKFLSSSFVNLNHGGKYSDVSFLSKLLSLGEFIWIPDPLMLTRVHRGNDSGNISIPDKLKLIRYMIARGIEKKSTRIKRYKFEYWRIWFSDRGYADFSLRGAWRVRIVRKFLITFVFFRMTKFFYYQSLIQRIKSKFLFDSRLRELSELIEHYK